MVNIDFDPDAGVSYTVTYPALFFFADYGLSVIDGASNLSFCGSTHLLMDE